MTDQNQVTDPKTQGTQQDDQNNQDNDIFGGGGDIFENSDILEPINDTVKKEDADQEEVTPEIVETMPNNEPEQIKEENIEVKKEDESKSDDFFDPFNDELDEIEETKEVVEEVKEDEKPEIVVDDMPDFENSPEIDALDDLDNLEELETIEEPKKVVEEIKEEVKEEKIEVKKEKVNIEWTIERIERRAKEAKLAAEKIEAAKVETKKPAPEVKKEIKVEEKIEPVIVEEKIEDKKIEKTEVEEIVKKEEPTKENNIEIKKEDPLKTDLQNKFTELVNGTKEIYELIGKDAEEWFDIVGWNDDRIKTTYNIIMWEDYIEINKFELNKADNKVQEYKLEFIVNKASLNVKVDDELLYDEVTDLQENANKKMQVMEKLNKFIFLITEEFKKLEIEKWKKEKRNIMKWIFRNFMF